MKQSRWIGGPGVWFVSCAVAWGCSSSPELLVDGDADSSSDATADASSGDGNDSAGDLSVDGNADAGTGGKPPVGSDPCLTVDCGLGQRCEVVDDDGVCIDNTCEELTCESTEACTEAPDGGFYCQDISCDSDVACPASQYCDGDVCVDDVCSPGTLSCNGTDAVLACQSNGSGTAALFSCAGGAYFESSCGAQAAGTGCSCQDEWDCPLFTTCDAGRCVGTGVEPTCALPPVDFESVLPDREFRWGGTSVASPAAADWMGPDGPVGRPFPSSAHVSSTPLVVNLDDDNGDGLVNERDFPEIVFISYRTGDDVRRNGVVRAIHATGNPRGQDYFAVCGNAVWREGDPIAADSACDFGTDNASWTDEPFALPGGAAAVGDLDGDGFPEIVVPTTRRSLLVLNNRGEVLVESAPWQWPGGYGQTNPSHWVFATVALANLDHAGPAEAIVGNRVFTFKLVPDGDGVPQLTFDRVFAGNQKTGVQGTDFGAVVCAGDVSSTHPGLEVVAGTSAYGLPAAPSGDPGCALPENAATDYCTNKLTLVWDTTTAFGTNEATGGIATSRSNGYCAIADVLGADPTLAPGPAPDAPLDQKPEVVLIANGWLVVLDGETGKQVRLVDLGGGTVGGAPNVDDFDGDGFPEVATALANFYRVVDFQTPTVACPAWPTTMTKTEAVPGANTARAPGGTGAEGSCSQDSDCAAGAFCAGLVTGEGHCGCLHSGWQRATEDDSSKATSSSVFDFNGDGAAEVAYNDECYFRIFDGASGAIHLAIPSLSRTVLENPAIADVDNDGNAEIVTVTNSDVLQCGETTLTRFPAPTDGPATVGRADLPNGIEVWGEASDAWVSARRVWNQQAYHVTNVTEAGALPRHEPENYKPYGGRQYNTYRSQPRVYGVAPDLTLTAIEVSSPDVSCGVLSEIIDVTVEVKNEGDLRVGPGVTLAFFGEWASPIVPGPLVDENGDPLTITLTQSLEPGASVLLSVRFDAQDAPSGELPSFVSATIDSLNAERECDETDNSIDTAVEPSESLADLRLEFVGTPNCAQARVRVTNDGSATATDVKVTIYAGNPAQGGTPLATVTVASALEPGQFKEKNVDLGTLERSVVLFGIADPNDTIEECNSQNNVAAGPGLDCGTVVH